MFKYYQVYERASATIGAVDDCCASHWVDGLIFIGLMPDLTDAELADMGGCTAFAASLLEVDALYVQVVTCVGSFQFVWVRLIKVG